MERVKDFEQLYHTNPLKKIPFVSPPMKKENLKVQTPPKFDSPSLAYCETTIDEIATFKKKILMNAEKGTLRFTYTHPEEKHNFK